MGAAVREVVPRRQAQRCYNCVDRHVEAGLGDKVAYLLGGRAGGGAPEITYAELQRDVVRVRERAQGARVRKGTPVAIYMGMVPELPVAMLACTRLGAPHTVVFGGFSADSLSDRMNDMGCEVLSRRTRPGVAAGGCR